MKKDQIKPKSLTEKKSLITKPVIVLLIIVILLVLFNQFQINNISKLLDKGFSAGSSSSRIALFSGDEDLSNIDLESLKSTGHTLVAVFPVKDIQTTEDAIAILFPTGTPDYGEELGVSYDDPIKSLDILAKTFRGLRIEVQKNNPEGWQRYINLATRPVGISCEFCCGVGPIGVDKNGNLLCGCQHNPAVQTVALYLSAYTDYSDGEILREVMRWKTLFFPKNMIELGMTVAGGDTSALDNLPGMVGGC